MKQGFALIELLVVVLIIGILAAVAVPQYRVAVERARVTRALPMLRSIVDAKERYFMANGHYTADLDLLDVQISYAGRTESDVNSWQYTGTPVGGINISPSNSGVFWWGKTGDLTIDFYSGSQICYGHNKTGDRVCASFGPKIAEHSGSSGWPVYQINF